jgi:hypothetical protein
MKKVESQLRRINPKKRTIEITMQFTRNKRRLASGNPARLSPVRVLSPANGELITPHPPYLFLHFFAFQATVD